MNGNFDTSQATGQLTVASAATSMTLFGLSLSEISVVVSAAVAVLTFALHVWYTMRKDRREAEAARLSTSSDGKEDDSPSDGSE